MTDRRRAEGHREQAGLGSRMGAILAAGLVLGGHLTAIYALNVTWDEFALFARAHDTLRTGQLQVAGRPGLATLLLVPLADGCESALGALRHGRWIWTLFSVAIVAGLWAFVRRLIPGRPWTWAALAAAAYVCIPEILRHSVEVRTDQPALAFALWGGVALLASQRRAWVGVLAGALVGVGFLFSQKAAYVAALVGFSAVVVGLRTFRLRRDVVRVLLTLVGGVGALVAYDVLVPLVFELPPPYAVSRQLDIFDFYRQHIGFYPYFRAAPFFLAHGIVLAVVALATVRGPWSRDRVSALILIWGVVALGIGVMAFHAGSFAYFLLTLGLFPAVVVGLGGPVVAERYGTGRTGRIAIGALWVMLLTGGVVGTARIVVDTQGPQREAFSFVERNFPPDARGFHTDRAFVCRGDPDPLPVVWGRRAQAFRSPAEAAQRQAFMEEFRRRPIQFFVASVRLDELPASVLDFLWRHYVAYRANVAVPGFRLSGTAQREAEVLVPGQYRWIPDEADSVTRLRVGDVELTPGEELRLEAGTYVVEGVGSGVRGMLVLALEDPPALPSGPFYIGL